MTDRPQAARRRGIYVLLLAAIVLMGLASRSEALSLSAFWAKYLGDMFWAMMVFVGLRILLPKQSTAFLAALAFGICCAVEFSQLYHAAGIDKIRATWIGKLVLGSSFSWPDFLAYLAGIVIASVIEWRAFCRHGQYCSSNRE
jgi:glycopeptide antibiotics resistance protein